MHMRFICILTVLFIYSSGICQTDFDDKRLTVLTAPLSVLDFYNGPTINLGAEIKLKNNISSYSSFHLHLSDLGISDNMNHTGFQFDQAFRYYLNKDNKINGSYLSVILSYSKQSYSRNDSISLSELPIDNYRKTYDLEKVFYGLNINYGKDVIKKKRLVLNIYAGLGLRFNSVECNISELEANNRYLGDWNNPKNWIHKCGTHVIPNFNLGFRIGYRIL